MGLQNGLDELVTISKSDLYQFVQYADAAFWVDQANENDLSRCNREMVNVNLKIGRQHAQPFGATELC